MLPGCGGMNAARVEPVVRIVAGRVSDSPSKPMRAPSVFEPVRLLLPAPEML